MKPNVPNEEKKLQENSLEYHLFVLRRMIKELPSGISSLLESQLDEVEKSIKIRNLALFKYIVDQLQDVRLSVLNMEFDLGATKKEKTALEERLRDKGLL